MGKRDDRGGYRSARITSATTTTVKAGAGIVHAVVVEAATTGTVTFNDSVGTKLLLPAAYPAGPIYLDVGFAGKIEVVTSAADRVVVSYD